MYSKALTTFIKKKMNTLLALNKHPHCIINKPTRDQTPQPLNSSPLNVFTHGKSSWKLHAQYKGFGNASNNKSMQKKGNTSKSSPSQQEEQDEEDKIPQVVFDRMFTRILASVGLPMSIGVVCLKLIDYVVEKQLWSVPRWVTFVTTFVFLGSSVLGVAYGSLSTNWDAEKSGSFLGIDEAKENWNEMWKVEEDNKK